MGVLGSQTYWQRVVEAFDGSSPVLRHVNGNVSFAPSFHNLINQLMVPTGMAKMEIPAESNEGWRPFARGSRE